MPNHIDLQVGLDRHRLRLQFLKHMVREELGNVHETIRTRHPMLLLYQRAFQPKKTETHLLCAAPRSNRGQQIHRGVLGLSPLPALPLRLLIRCEPLPDPLAHDLRRVRIEPGADEGMEHVGGSLAAGGASAVAPAPGRARSRRMNSRGSSSNCSILCSTSCRVSLCSVGIQEIDGEGGEDRNAPRSLILGTTTN